jgi:hypothetical protein
VEASDEDARGLGRIGPFGFEPGPLVETYKDGHTASPTPEQVVELANLDGDHPSKRLALRYLVSPTQPLHYYDNHLWRVSKRSWGGQSPLFYITEDEAKLFGLTYNPAVPLATVISFQTSNASPTGDIGTGSHVPSLQDDENTDFRTQLDLLDLDFSAIIVPQDPWRPQLFATDYTSPEWYPVKPLKKFV